MILKVKKIEKVNDSGQQYYKSESGGLFLFIPAYASFGRNSAHEWHACLSYSGEPISKIDENKLQIIIESEEI